MYKPLIFLFTCLSLLFTGISSATHRADNNDTSEYGTFNDDEDENTRDSSNKVRYYVKPQVFRVMGNSICRVTSRGQLKAMKAGDDLEDMPNRLSAITDESEISDCAWPDGLYADSEFHRVARIHNGKMCEVDNRMQLNAFGGRDKVTVLDNAEGIVNANQDMGICRWPDGFYRVKNRDRIVRLDRNRACGVTSRQHLRLLGGKDKVREVPDNTHIAAGREKFGPCPWSTGFYRVEGEQLVRYIHGGLICNVSSEKQLRKMGGRRNVIDVAYGTNITQGKRDIGRCR